MQEDSERSTPRENPTVYLCSLRNGGPTRKTMLCSTLQEGLFVSALLIFFTGFTSCEDTNEEPVVRVEQGELRGHRIQREEGATIPALYAFEGIPYARPPIGSRRFQDPEETEPWSGVRNATTFGSNCIGIEFTGVITGNENCLFLNIYTADPPSQWKTQKRPVLVYIHGGAFIQGSGDMINTRPDPLLREGLLVVSINYRLGVLGFLNTEDSQAPGNAALKDQALSLRWVHRNIAVFGGDPTQVTILGISAGACSVHYQILAPLSRGFFHRAVSMSGTVIPRWALVDNPRQHAEDLRNRWSSACPQETEDEIVHCLQRVDAVQLFSSQFTSTEVSTDILYSLRFRPSLEVPGTSAAPFITENPEAQLREGRFKRVPYITGFVSTECLSVIGSLRWEQIEDNFEDIFRWLMPLGVPRTRKNVDQVREFYLGNRTLINADENLDTLNRFVQMCSDTLFAEGTVQSAHLMSKRRSEVFVYRFAHDGPAGIGKRILNLTSIPGVMHGDDFYYVFDIVQDGQLVKFPASEERIRERQVKIFANFAKTGNPTPPGSGLLEWPVFTPHKESYMNMGDELRVHDHALGERMAFWRRLMSTPPTSRKY